MKRIDLLIQLVKNIYKLLKTHVEAPCSCTVPVSKMHESFGYELLRNLTEILKNIEKQVHVSNELVMLTCKEDSPETCQPREPEAIQEVLKRQQVIDILKISERTYYRHLKNGVLVPRQLGNRSYFYHSDLVEALKYSKVHGYL